LPRALKGQVPQALTSFNKIASRIDWSRTRAYCPSAPGSGLWINLKGESPEGIVSPGAEYERVVAELTEKLLAYRDPKTGEAIVTAVHRREDVYAGPYAEGGADLQIETGRTVCMIEGSAGSRSCRRARRRRSAPATTRATASCSCGGRTSAAARRSRRGRSRT
jgi:hypothetical protein